MPEIILALNKGKNMLQNIFLIGLVIGAAYTGFESMASLNKINAKKAVTIQQGATHAPNIEFTDSDVESEAN